MPTYDYQCANCGVFEATQRITEEPLAECPTCHGKEIKRLLSAPAFHLKGTGWYKTDYASNGSSVSSSSSSSTTSTKPASDVTTPSSEGTKKDSCSGSCACGSAKSDTAKTSGD